MRKQQKLRGSSFTAFFTTPEVTGFLIPVLQSFSEHNSNKLFRMATVQMALIKEVWTQKTGFRNCFKQDLEIQGQGVTQGLIPYMEDGKILVPAEAH